VPTVPVLERLAMPAATATAASAARASPARWVADVVMEAVESPKPEQPDRSTAYYDDVVRGGEVYDGLPLERLPIEVIDVPDPEHLRRSARYQGAVDIEAEHAMEAVFDPRRLVARDPVSRTGEAIRVVGYSTGMRRLLVVLMIPDRHPPDGVWHIATAWPANRRTRAVYEAEEDSDG
jgi:hypothetical protein